MRNRLLTIIASLAVVLGLSLSASPSHAATYITKKDCTSDGYVCLTVTFWKDDLHQGIGVYNIVGNCTIGGSGPLFGWDDPAIDGHGLDAYNDTSGVLFWTIGESSNVYDTGGSCQNSWYVGVDKPNSHSVTVYWHFTAQFNVYSDYTKTLSVTQLNN